MKYWSLAGLAILACSSVFGQGAGLETNSLLNPIFEFHCFKSHRLGERERFAWHNVAFWNTEAWGDITVTREAHVDANVRPAFTCHNLVSIAPGKRLWLFSYDSRANRNFERRLLGHATPGEAVSFSQPFKARRWCCATGDWGPVRRHHRDGGAVRWRWPRNL